MKRIIWGLLLISIVVVGACQPRAESNNVRADEPIFAPDFRLRALDGTVYTLSELRGTPVIINFWATWCVPCMTEMPALQEIADIYSGRLVLLGVNLRETRDVVAAFVEERAIRFPILLNPPDSVVLAYQVMNLPQTILISARGEMVYRQFGAVEIAALSQQIADYFYRN